jgi:hypothetical protein
MGYFIHLSSFFQAGIRVPIVFRYLEHLSIF